MKKNIVALTVAMITASSFCFLNSKDPNLLQVTFAIKNNQTSQANAQLDQNLKYIFEIFKSLADTQKKRNLTIEEMIMIIQFTSFLYTDLQNNYSQHIEIKFDGNVIKLPFSQELLLALSKQSIQNDQDDQDPQENVA